MADRYARAAAHHRAAADLQRRHGRQDLADEALYRAQMAELWREKALAEIEAHNGVEPPLGSPEELAAEVRRLKLEIANLRLAVESNRRIAMAIGIVMCRYDMTSQNAFAALRRASQNAHRKLHDIAESVIHLRGLPGPAGLDGEPASANGQGS